MRPSAWSNGATTSPRRHVAGDPRSDVTLLRARKFQKQRDRFFQKFFRTADPSGVATPNNALFPPPRPPALCVGFDASITLDAHNVPNGLYFNKEFAPKDLSCELH